jgi:hypothetical protein
MNGVNNRRVLAGKESDDNPSESAKRPRVVDSLSPQETHRALVAAIYSVGLKEASPSVIMEHMTQQCVGTGAITSERIKSHVSRLPWLNAFALLMYSLVLIALYTCSFRSIGSMTKDRGRNSQVNTMPG